MEESSLANKDREIAATKNRATRVLSRFESPESDGVHSEWQREWEKHWF